MIARATKTARMIARATNTVRTIARIGSIAVLAEPDERVIARTTAKATRTTAKATRTTAQNSP
jgi:hypothetical protein